MAESEKVRNFALANGKQARFLSNRIFKDGAVVQLVRILACHARGRGFESRPHRRGERKEQHGKLRFPVALFLFTFCEAERLGSFELWRFGSFVWLGSFGNNGNDGNPHKNTAAGDQRVEELGLGI